MHACGQPVRYGDQDPVAASMARPVGRQNSATVFDQGFCVARSYSLMRPPRTGRRLIRSREGPAIGWSGREELTAAMGSSSVVVGLVLSQDRPQVAVTEDQHPVGDLRPGGEHEPFGAGDRAGTSGRDDHGFDACAGKLACHAPRRRPRTGHRPLTKLVADQHRQRALAYPGTSPQPPRRSPPRAAASAAARQTSRTPSCGQDAGKATARMIMQSASAARTRFPPELTSRVARSSKTITIISSILIRCLLVHEITQKGVGSAWVDKPKWSSSPNGVSQRLTSFQDTAPPPVAQSSPRLSCFLD